MSKAKVCLLCILMFLCAVGCSQRSKDQLVIAIAEDNREGYDPVTGWGRYGNSLFHSTILKRDNDLKIVKDLATVYSLSDNKRVWKISIRRDAKFSDGKPLTANDVVFTFNKAASSGARVDMTSMEKAVKIGDYDLELRLKKPDITFIDHLITLGIVPEHLYNDKYSRNPIGSGLYKMVSLQEGEQMIIEENPYYYGKKPAIKSVVFLFLSEDAAFAAAKSGKADIVAVPQSLAIQKVNGMTLHPVKSVDNRGIMLPCVPDTGKKTDKGYPIGNNVTSVLSIRKALNLGIDRNILVKGILEGYGTPAYGVVDGLPWDEVSGRIESGKIEEAKKVLRSDGWGDSDKDGILERKGLKAEFKLVYESSDSIRQNLAVAVADQAKKIGIKINIEGKTWDEIDTMDHAVAVLFGWGSHNPLEMYGLFHSSQAGIEYNNCGYYSNEKVDKYFDMAMNASSFEDSIKYWKLAQWDGKTGFAMKGDAPWVWLVNLTHTYFVSDRLDIGKSRMEPHGHGWPLTSNINEWKWINR